MAELLKSMLPADFDLDAALKQFGAAIRRMNESADKIDQMEATIRGQKEVIDLLNVQLKTLVQDIAPEARPIFAWAVENGKTGEVHLSQVSTEGMITPEDIAENQLTISPLFK